jgi:hypothetical protein
MRDGREAVDALIDRVVRESNLRDPGAREELRRELASHFEETGSSEEALRAALERFGNPSDVVHSFRRAYRRGRTALYAAKVLASIGAASVAALALQVPVNLRLTSGANTAIHLGSGYPISAWFSVFIVVMLVAAWELDIEPLCARLERRPLRLALAFGGLFATILVGHPIVHGSVGVHGHMDLLLMLLGSAAGVAVWASTVAITARIEMAFVSLFGPRLR